MKETTFIKQNKKKWARFEKLSGKKTNDPDEVSKLFTEITEDLSYARTFYPRRSVRVYLNQLAQGVFTSLYKQRKQPLGSAKKFWKETVPLEMYRARFALITSFAFFVLAILIGAISTHYNHDFIELIFPPEQTNYIANTEARIEAGDPMGVYGEQPQTSMFLQITMNNIRVAFIAFTSGFFLTIGTFAMLLSNGIMLGAFQYWFKLKGLFLTSFLAIWIHGAFEISSIIIAGAAGITIGHGILFPRSFTRMQSLVFAAKRGLTIMLSLIPVFILAGLLESFVTRYYNVMPALLKWAIIITSFALIILYYVIYPYIVARKNPDKIEIREVPRYIPERKLKWNKIRKTGEVFTDTFYVFIRKASPIFRLFFAFIFPLSIGLMSIIFALEIHRFDFNMTMLETMRALFGAGDYFEWYKFVGWSFIMAVLFSAIFHVITSDDDDNLYTGFFKFCLRRLIWMWMFTAVVFGIITYAPFYLILLLVFLAPFIGMIPANIAHGKKDFFTAFGNSFNLGKGAYGDSLGSFAIFLLIFFIFKFALEIPFDWWFFADFDILSIIDKLVKDLTINLFDRYQAIIIFINGIIFIFFLFVMFSVYALSFSFAYHSSNEMKTAKGLYKRLESFGKRNKQFETEMDYD